MRLPLAALADRLPPARSGLALSFGSVAAIQLLNVISGTLLARELGPTGRGEFAAVVLWPMLLAFLGDLGVGEALTYYTAHHRNPLGQMIGTSLLLAAMQSVIFVALGFGLIPLVLSGQESHVVSSALHFLLFIPVTMTLLHLLGIVNGLQRFAWFNGLRFLAYLLITAALVALVILGHLTIESAAITYILANLIVLFVAAGVLLRSGSGPLRVNLPLARELLSFGIRTQTSNASLLFNERLDQLVMSVFLAPAKLGNYLVAATLSSVAVLPGTATSFVTLPVIAKSQRGAQWIRDIPVFIRVSFALSATVAAALFFLAPWLIDLFFGSEFSPAVDPCRILLVASVLLSTNRVLAAALKGIGRPLDAGIAESAGLAVTVVGLAVLLPTLGIVGAAIASLAAYAVSFVFMVRRVSSALGVRPAALAFSQAD